MARVVALAIAIAVMLIGCSAGAQATPPVSPSSASSLTSRDVANALAAAGLEAADPREMTIKDFGVAPKLTDDGTRFFIPSLGPDNGGRAFVFANVADLRKTKDYYDSLGKSSAMFFSWTFANEPMLVLVQINGELPKSEAAKYGEVVNGLH